MAKSSARSFSQDDAVEGAAMLRRVFPMLAGSGTQRNKAGNRQLLFSQYAALILVCLFNPLLNSARALVAASGLKKVRQLTGGRKVSLGSFSEAASVFEPALLEGLIRQLRQEVHQQRGLAKILRGSQAGGLSDQLIERLIAVDGLVLTALPQLVGRLSNPQKGQWHFHALLSCSCHSRTTCSYHTAEFTRVADPCDIRTSQCSKPLEPTRSEHQLIGLLSGTS